jgi:DNA polymerase-1
MIVDAMNLFVRCFIASPLLSQGQHIGGITGFIQSLNKMIFENNPQECVVVWEGGGSLRRRQIFPDYKGKRKPQRLNRFQDSGVIDTVDNRNWQIKSIIEILNYLPIRQIYISDCEADDVIGYLTRYHYNEQNVLIVSSDHDYLQLLNENVKIWSPTLKGYVDENWVLKKYQISPKNFCLARCFSGDKSDMIQGVKGIGIKTLVNSFPQFSESEEVDLDDIIDYARERSKVSNKKIYTNIIENEDLIKRNYKLMRLDVSNLSGNQLGKLMSSMENSIPSAHKMNMIKTLIKCGIQTIDIDKIFININNTLKRKTNE